MRFHYYSLGYNFNHAKRSNSLLFSTGTDKNPTSENLAPQDNNPLPYDPTIFELEASTNNPEECSRKEEIETYQKPEKENADMDPQETVELKDENQVQIRTAIQGTDKLDGPVQSSSDQDEIEEDIVEEPAEMVEEEITEDIAEDAVEPLEEEIEEDIQDDDVEENKEDIVKNRKPEEVPKATKNKKPKESKKENKKTKKTKQSLRIGALRN